MWYVWACWVRYKKVLNVSSYTIGCYSISMWNFTTSKLWCHNIRYVIISENLNCLTLATECSFFRILCRVIFTNKVEFVWRFPEACRDKCFSQSWLFNFLSARGHQECVFILTQSTMVGITNLCYGCANKGTHRSRIAATLLTHWPVLPNDRVERILISTATEGSFGAGCGQLRSTSWITQLANFRTLKTGHVSFTPSH